MSFVDSYAAEILRVMVNGRPVRFKDLRGVIKNSKKVHEACSTLLNELFRYLGRTSA